MLIFGPRGFVSLGPAEAATGQNPEPARVPTMVGTLAGSGRSGGRSLPHIVRMKLTSLSLGLVRSNKKSSHRKQPWLARKAPSLHHPGWLAAMPGRPGVGRLDAFCAEELPGLAPQPPVTADSSLSRRHR